MSTYLMSVRAIENNSFLNEPGKTHYLYVPDNAATIETSHIIHSKKSQSAGEIWISKIFGHKPDNIAVYVHGYNYSHSQLLHHLRIFKKGLTANGFSGVVVGFDWPSAKVLVNYIEDRIDAKKSAARLLQDCIWPIMRHHHQVPIHIIAHSTGAYIVKQAFDQTENTFDSVNTPYYLEKIIFFAGDIAQKKFYNSPDKNLILKHCKTFINYYNKKDEALEAANAIRLGLSPRIGQIGLLKNMSLNCCNKNFTHHYNKISVNAPNKIFDPIDYAYFTHMWYFEDAFWLKDLTSELLEIFPDDKPL